MAVERNQLLGAIVYGPALAEGDVSMGYFDTSKYTKNGVGDGEGFAQFIDDIVGATISKNLAKDSNPLSVPKNVVLVFDFHMISNIFPWKHDTHPESGPEDGSNTGAYHDEILYHIESLAIKYGCSVDCIIERNSLDLLKIEFKRAQKKMCLKKIGTKSELEEYITANAPTAPLPPIYEGDGSPLTFLQDHWARFKGIGIFYQFIIAKYDPAFVKALKNYCYNHRPDRLNLADYLPPKKAYTEDGARQALTQAAEGGPLSEVSTTIHPVGVLLRRQMRKGRAEIQP